MQAADNLGACIFYGNLGCKNVVIRRNSNGELAPGLVQVALLLGQVLIGQAVQLPGQQDIVKRAADIPVGGLPEDAQLFSGGLQPHLGGPDAGVDLAPGIERLGEGDVRRAAVLAGSHS